MDPLTPLAWVDAPSSHSLIAWSFLITNGARLITYMPQIIAVWRCHDGARALSLITWLSWIVSHVTSVLYGAVILDDMFFVAVSIINLVCSVIVVAIAGHRRAQWRRRLRLADCETAPAVWVRAL